MNHNTYDVIQIHITYQTGGHLTIHNSFYEFVQGERWQFNIFVIRIDCLLRHLGRPNIDNMLQFDAAQNECIKRQRSFHS